MKHCIIAFLCFCGVVLAQQNPLTIGAGVANEKPAGVHDTRIDFAQRSENTGYGYRGYTLPIGGTFLPWAVPNSESYVSGLRLNLGWGSYKDTVGLDLGVFSAGEEHAVLGINVFGHYSTQAAQGWEIGLVNVSGGSMAGLQIGLVNYADTLYGVQIGLINVSAQQLWLPILNIGW